MGARSGSPQPPTLKARKDTAELAAVASRWNPGLGAWERGRRSMSLDKLSLLLQWLCRAQIRATPSVKRLLASKRRTSGLSSACQRCRSRRDGQCRVAKMVGLTQRSKPLRHRPVVPSFTDHDSFSQCEGSAHDPGARFCTYFSSKSWSAILWPPGRATDGRAALGWRMLVICSEGQTSRSTPPSTCAEEANAQN